MELPWVSLMVRQFELQLDEVTNSAFKLDFIKIMRSPWQVASRIFFSGRQKEGFKFF